MTVTNNPNSPIVVNAGEPAGIGPDLCIALATTDWSDKVVVVADTKILHDRATQLGANLTMREYEPGGRGKTGELRVLPINLPNAVNPGQLNPANSAELLAGLDRAVTGCLSQEFSALVTGPLQKSVVIDAGIDFVGHTEFLAARTGSATPVMLLVADEMRVALASIHMPLRDVPDYLTSHGIAQVMSVLDHDLKTRFGIKQPRILVCGLNPHAGENGHLGSEDDEVVRPAIEKCREDGIDAIGPLPADTAFTPAAGERDAVLAMYHDQGLPVIKNVGFGKAVNVTLGLPIIRTSVDHGTALDLAGKGTADPGSLLAAVKLAERLVSNRAYGQ